MAANGPASIPSKAPTRLWLRRIAWMVALWTASVAAMAVVAYGFRVIMAWVGLSR